MSSVLTIRHYLALNPPAAIEANAFQVNVLGNVLGDYFTNSAGASGDVYASGQYTLLDGSAVAIYAPGATFTTLTGISDDVEIAGYFGTSSAGTEGFIYSGGGPLTNNGTFTTFAPPGVTNFETLGINIHGEVIGESFAKKGSRVTGQSFLYDAGTLTSIDLPGSLGTNVLGLNDSGITLGTYEGIAGTHGFIDDAGSYTRVDIPNAQATEINAISGPVGTSGSYFVTGDYTDAQDVEHAFRATVALTSQRLATAVVRSLTLGRQN
jgi:hypothetical protein